jgi:hypothetical protein
LPVKIIISGYLSLLFLLPRKYFPLIDTSFSFLSHQNLHVILLGQGFLIILLKIACIVLSTLWPGKPCNSITLSILLFCSCYGLSPSLECKLPAGRNLLGLFISGFSWLNQGKAPIRWLVHLGFFLNDVIIGYISDVLSDYQQRSCKLKSGWESNIWIWDKMKLVGLPLKRVCEIRAKMYLTRVCFLCNL